MSSIIMSVNLDTESVTVEPTVKLASRHQASMKCQDAAYINSHDLSKVVVPALHKCHGANRLRDLSTQQI